MVPFFMPSTIMQSVPSVGELNIVVSFCGVVGGASENPVTDGHMTFREVTSISLW